MLNFTDDIFVAWAFLHSGGDALHMHKDEGYVPAADDAGHVRIIAQGGDVVDDVGAGLDGGGGDFGGTGVDRHGDAKTRAAGVADDGDYALNLLLRGDGRGPGAG